MFFFVHMCAYHVYIYIYVCVYLYVCLYIHIYIYILLRREIRPGQEIDGAVDQDAA